MTGKVTCLSNLQPGAAAGLASGATLPEFCPVIHVFCCVCCVSIFRISPVSWQGTIKCSNLCTEILEYTSPEETAVCNLASISLPRFVRERGVASDRVKLTGSLNAPQRCAVLRLKRCRLLGQSLTSAFASAATSIEPQNGRRFASARHGDASDSLGTGKLMVAAAVSGPIMTSRSAMLRCPKPCAGTSTSRSWRRSRAT